MGHLLMMLQSLAMIIARLMWLRLGLGLGITFSHHWYFHFDNDFHKTPICARVSGMAQGLTSPTSDLPFFRSSTMSTSKEQLLPLSCLGHVCLDSCKDNTLLDLCVCVFDKWWRRRCRPRCPPPALASVSSVFFFCLLLLQPHPLSLLLLLLPSLRFFVDTYSHCFSPYSCPPATHPFLSRPALPWPYSFIQQRTRRLIRAHFTYCQPWAEAEGWGAEGVT